MLVVNSKGVPAASADAHPMAPGQITAHPALSGPKAWFTDIACLKAAHGHTHLAAIVELLSKHSVGWADATTLPVSMALGFPIRFA